MFEKVGGLPAEYVQLSYLSITGTNQHIKTDYIPSASCKIEVTFQATSTTSNKAGVLFGCRSGYNNNALYFRTLLNSGSAVNMDCYIAYKTERTFTHPNVMNNVNTFGVDNGRFYINDTTLATYTDVFTPAYAIYLMRINSAGSAFSPSPVGNLFSAKVWEGGQLVRDYIPVQRIADSVTGMFDLITQTFETLN